MKRPSPAQSKRVDVEEEDLAATSTPDSARKRHAVNRHGLQLTKSGRVAGSANYINTKCDSAYRNSENENRLLGRSLTLGQACGIISVCLYGPDIPMEHSGILLYSPYLHMLHILHISNSMTYLRWSLYHRTCQSLSHPQICCMVFTDRRGIG